MNAALDVNAVSRYFGEVTALRDVSLSVGEGESVALIGHNGAGKTTLFRLVLGFLQPHEGQLTISGHRPGDPQARRAVSYLPESVAFPKTLTGLEVVRFYADLRRSSRATALEVLERVGLSDAMHRRCGAYSKGMRQRLGLAQALMGSPRLLLLDEPTSGLDPTSRHTFYTLLGEISAAGTAVVLSSHGLSEIESQTDRVCMLSEGKLVAEGSLDALLLRASLPATVLVRAVSVPAATLAQAFGGRIRQDGWVEIECPMREKLAVVRQLLALDEQLTQLEFRSPGLNELYRHYASRDLVPGGEAVE